LVTSSEIKQQYEQQGYFIVDDFLDEETHSKLLMTCDTLVANPEGVGWAYNENGTIQKLRRACAAVPEFLSLASHPSLVQIAKEFLDPPVDIFISKFFPMQPNARSTFMHQDNYYIHERHGNMMSCAIYLQDTSKENGCLRVVPKSHQSGLYDHTKPDQSVNNLYWIDESGLTDVVDLERKAPYAVFFHPNLIHGCYINKSNSTRYSLAWEYICGHEKIFAGIRNKIDYDRTRI